MKGPKGYTLRTLGAMRYATSRIGRLRPTKAPNRTAAAFMLALAISLGLWALVAAGWLILD